MQLSASTRSLPLNAALYTVAFFLLMLVYGGKICPFVDSLDVWKWAVVLLVGYVLVYAVRLLLAPWLVWRAPMWEQGYRQFLLEMFLAVALGLGVTVFNAAAFSFPVGSGIKVMVALVCFGFFMALDMTLAREREVIRAARLAGLRLDPDLPYSPLTRKVTLLSSIWVISNTLIVSLVVYKDLEYLASFSAESFHAQILPVIAEIFFVGLVLLALTLKVLWSFGRNLSLAFEMQTEVLGAVEGGQFDRYVPVVSGDEFAAIARKTNDMIDGLRDKERLQSVFGKLVDPQVASRLLGKDGSGLTLGGERRDLVIMLVDIRDFTHRVEGGSPEGVVEDLNLFFSVVVKVVNQHGGMVDKFLGDGVLAVFGLESGAESAAGSALRAAVEMELAVRKLDPVLRQPIRIGVGLDAGAVISGLIGSPERLEFTVIGDAVNTASRLEGLTKRLNLPIIASCAFRHAVAESEVAINLKPLGEHRVRGKRDPVEIWGVEPRDFIALKQA